MFKKPLLVLIVLLQSYAVCKSQELSRRAENKKPKNVILLIGDGMGVAQIYAGLTANKGSLNLEKFKHVGFSKTYSSNRYITESGAGATAIAIGVKTHNSAVGVDKDDKPMPTILEIAERNGLSTGLVATTDLTDATPAAFTAHVSLRDKQEDIALDYLKSGVDVFIGAGQERFTKRADKRDLTEDLVKMGFKVSSNIKDITNTKSGKLAGFLQETSVAKRGDQLEETSMTAVKILSQNPKGFFLMIEGSKIDDGGHRNDIKVVVDEMIDFDKAIGKVLEFAEKDGETLVIVTADHETGGLTLTGGDFKSGKVDGKFSTEGHTSVMVPVFAYGPQAQTFGGIYDNHTIFAKIMKAFRFKEK